MKNNIKVLDCTLRDGGYVNDWKFNKKNICKIIENLIKAKINFIECGFYKPIEYNSEKSIFSQISQLKNLYKSLEDTKLTLMINYGEYPIEEIPQCQDSNIMFRVVFKKNQIEGALEYCRQLQAKGYNIFINPMHTNTYSAKELLELLEQVNQISPRGFTIVDTTGAMKEKDILFYFYLIDNNLSKHIALCFHSHNNLQLSFSNAQCLMKICSDRELIIDSTVFGIGRGAGNLCTELITQYINDNYSKEYNIVPILKIVDEQINPIFAITPWGYSVPYYLAATNHCHPNYAKYLVDKQSVPVEIINKLLQAIPDNKKSSYDVNLIRQIYLDNFSQFVDDTIVINNLKNELQNKNILILAPGKSLTEEKNIINQFIENKKPFIISLNFIPTDYDTDITFISNIKRFSSLEKYTGKLLVTSNIEDIPSKAEVINYSSYLNNSKMFDNAVLMFLKLLIKIGINEVNIAGLDGFSNISTENYVSTDLINAKINEFDEKNIVMSNELQNLSKDIAIHFITKTKYMV